MDVQHMAIVVHLWLERRTVVRLVTNVCWERALEKYKKVRENYKIETNRKLFDDIVGPSSYYIVFITFFDGMRLKDIFLRASRAVDSADSRSYRSYRASSLPRFCDRLHFPDARLSEMLDHVLRRCDLRQIAVFAGVGENREAAISDACIGV
jgi:hypothetical protein